MHVKSISFIVKLLFVMRHYILNVQKGSCKFRPPYFAIFKLESTPKVSCFFDIVLFKLTNKLVVYPQTVNKGIFIFVLIILINFVASVLINRLYPV